MITYPSDYNPIILYWEEINKHPERVGKKIHAQIKKLVSDITDQTSDVYFDPAKSNHAIEFIENYCRHIKGLNFAGKLIELDLYQKSFIASIFGICYKKTHLRRTNRAVMIVGKKNGKSLLASAIGLYMMIADGEGGPECYSVATKKDQAKIIWNVAKKMVAKDKELRRLCRSLVAEILGDFNDSIFKPLASDSDTLDGLDVHFVSMDEIHQWKNGYRLYDIMTQGTTNREQPLALITTTAGTIREDLYDILYTEAKNIIHDFDTDNGFKDENAIFYIYELDDREEWKDFNKLIKANPGLGTSRNIESLRKEHLRALNNPEQYLKGFLTKACNIPETSSESWLTSGDIINEATYNLSELKVDYVIGGVDMSSTTDLTCVTFLFKITDNDQLFADQLYFIPSETIHDKEVEDKVPYQKWADRGLIHLIEGYKIEQSQVIEIVEKYLEERDLIPLWTGFDTWGAEVVMHKWKAKYGNQSVEPVIQGAKTQSNPMKALKADLKAKRINFNRNPILQWCLRNTAIKTDENANIRPVKGSSRLLRIDGTVSLLNAYIAYQRHREEYDQLLS